MEKYDHVVIGSGVSGLTTAIILGKFGKRVALLEQYSHTAPLIRRFKRNNSWCDPGFHYSGGLNDTGSLSVLFRYLGVGDKIKTLAMDPDGFDILYFRGDKEYKMPYGFVNLQDYLCQQFPNSAHAIRQYIQKIDQINQNTAFMNLNVPFNEFSSEIYLNHSLQSYLESIGAEEKLIELLGNHGYVLYGSHAAEIPLHIHAYIMGSFYESSSLIIDGGNSLANAFDDALKKYDISVFTNCSVNGFEIDQKKNLKGIYSRDSRYFECDSCISTIHPKLLIDMLKGTSVKPAYLNRIDRLENTMAAVVLFLEADEFPVQVQRTNYYEFGKEISSGKRTDYTAYMAVNPAAETNGKRSFTVIKPVSESLFKPFLGDKYLDLYEAYADLKEQIAEKVMKQINGKFPELENSLKILDVSTPVTYNRYTKTVDGCLYGVKQSVAYRGLTTRTSVHNLYLAGQSIQMGVMGAVTSGFIAALNIVDNKKLEKDIRSCF